MRSPAKREVAYQTPEGTDEPRIKREERRKVPRVSTVSVLGDRQVVARIDAHPEPGSRSAAATWQPFESEGSDLQIPRRVAMNTPAAGVE